MNVFLNNNKITYVLLPVMLAILPVAVVFFEEEPVPYILILLSLIFLNEKNKKLNFKRYRLFFKPYLLAILVYVLYTFVAVKITPALKIIERQVSLLLIPSIVFISSLSKERLRLFFNTFIVLMSIVSAFSIFLLLWFVSEHAEWIQTMNQTSQNQTYLQFKFPHLIGAHPTYWTYLLILANIFLLCSKSLNLRLRKTWVVVLLILFNINILYLSARTPTLINILIHITAFTIYLKTSKTSRVKMFALIFGVVLIGIVALKMPLLNAKFSNIINDERVFLWPRAIEQINNNNFILGEGLGQGKIIFKNYIIENGDPRINYNGFDLHNQYLIHYVEMGLLGLLALIYLIAYPLWVSRGELNFSSMPLIGFSILFIISLITESNLYYIKGIIIFSVFSSVLLRVYKDFNFEKEYTGV